MGEETIGEGSAIMLWKAKGPLSDVEHEQLAQKLQMEHERSGIKIVLVPFSVDAEITHEPNEDKKEVQAAADGQTKTADSDGEPAAANDVNE